MARRKSKPAGKRTVLNAQPRDTLPHTGAYWNADDSAVAVIDNYDPAFMPRIPEASLLDVDDLAAQTGLIVPDRLREQFLVDLDCAFIILTTHGHVAGGPPSHEVRDRMEHIRDDAQKLLLRLGAKHDVAWAETWEPSDLNLNRNVSAALIEAANEDRALIFSIVKAISALADFADKARIAAETEIEFAKSDQTLKFGFPKMLAHIFSYSFGWPTETRNGDWWKFSKWAYARVGLPLGADGPRDVLRRLKAIANLSI